MPTIGERLRAAREAKGLQLDDAHRQTKIHTKILQAIEEDRAGDLLDPAYAKAFLKQYATFLSVDPAPLVEEYRKTATPASPAATAGDNGRPWAASATRGARWVVPTIVAGVALVGIVFLGVLAKDLYHTVSTPTTAPTPAVGRTPPPAPPAPGSRWPEGRGAASAGGSRAAPPKPLVPKSQPLKLSVTAAQDCWMQVKADDTVLFQNILGRGREETWTAREGLELWVGNAAALTLTLNGHPLGPVGQGVIKGIRVTRRGLELPKKSSTDR